MTRVISARLTPLLIAGVFSTVAMAQTPGGRLRLRPLRRRRKR